jgi:hypothetical protein
MQRAESRESRAAKREQRVSSIAFILRQGLPTSTELSREQRAEGSEQREESRAVSRQREEGRVNVRANSKSNARSKIKASSLRAKYDA